MSADNLVVYVLEADDRAGVMHAIAAVFAHRGLSMHSLLADTGRKPSRILVSFAGTERQQKLVQQVLTRLHHVQGVRVLRTDSPELRAIAVGRLCGPLPELAEVIAQTHGDAVMLSGRYRDVEAAVSELESKGLIADVARSLVAL